MGTHNLLKETNTTIKSTRENIDMIDVQDILIEDQDLDTEIGDISSYMKQTGNQVNNKELNDELDNLDIEDNYQYPVSFPSIVVGKQPISNNNMDSIAIKYGHTGNPNEMLTEDHLSRLVYNNHYISGEKEPQQQVTNKKPIRVNTTNTTTTTTTPTTIPIKKSYSNKNKLWNEG